MNNVVVGGRERQTDRQRETETEREEVRKRGEVAVMTAFSRIDLSTSLFV